MPRPSSAPWERDEASYRNPVASGAYAPAVNSKAPFATDTSRRPCVFLFLFYILFREGGGGEGIEKEM